MDIGSHVFLAVVLGKTIGVIGVALASSLPYVITTVFFARRLARSTTSSYTRAAAVSVWATSASNARWPASTKWKTRSRRPRRSRRLACPRPRPLRNTRQVFWAILDPFFLTRQLGEGYHKNCIFLRGSSPIQFTHRQCRRRQSGVGLQRRRDAPSTPPSESSSVLRGRVAGTGERANGRLEPSS